MLTTVIEAINELPPEQQLQASNVSYQRFRDKFFHDDGNHKCQGKLLVIDNHMYACDICGKEELM